MNYELQLTLALGAGMLLESKILLQERENMWKPYLGVLCLTILMGGFMSIGNGPFSPIKYLFSCYFAFIIVYSMSFRKQLLSRISRYTILSYTTLFWIGFYIFIGNIYNRTFFSLAILFSVLAAYTILKKTYLSVFSQALLYCWFLITNIGLIFFQLYSRGVFTNLSLKLHNLEFGLFETFLLGMLLMYVSMLITYLIFSIPNARDTGLIEWKHHIKILAGKFDNQKMNVFYCLILIFFLLGLFYIQQKSELISPTLLMYVLMLTIGPLLHILSRTRE